MQRQTKNIKTISEFHRLRGLPQPEHPLISVIDYSNIVRPENISDVNWVLDFYQVSLKRGVNAKLKYGQQQYDFDEGVMFFIAPGQVFRIEPEAKSNEERSGWMLLIHPDFLWGSRLAKEIKQYDFFSYSIHEALFLSGKEETILNNILQNIEQEYHTNIDESSQSIIISQIETLLNYSKRFYRRQFITRKISNHRLLDQMEALLDSYFNSKDLTTKGLPSVQFIAASLNVSTGYLGSLLKTLTGKSTQQHLHEKLVEKAKEKLSTTSLSVNEIAYELGFEHAQSFHKLFKSKTGQSPLEFRAGFN
ncbi:MAG TPA: helix-turn-helix transcriptional regulator [Chitinophaga sp.]|uniref:helix-turn-helix domain-containing protein n=1 Tax=Chitinophaga sp. TaxID=1869181 RepID=UPI002DB71541|nr:helix-turn-helix transcriptional regulator [Chitinophaga sp.]HEU4555659.1 helix-turn-helix transcriptional regulator [Chitinophaga sp.]